MDTTRRLTGPLAPAAHPPSGLLPQSGGWLLLSAHLSVIPTGGWHEGPFWFQEPDQEGVSELLLPSAVKMGVTKAPSSKGYWED